MDFYRWSLLWKYVSDYSPWENKTFVTDWRRNCISGWVCVAVCYIDQHIRFPLSVSNKFYKKYYVKEEKCTLMLTCVHFKNVVPIINCMNLYKNHKRFEWKHLLFYLINKAKSARIFIKELIIRLLYCGNVNVLCQW